MELTIGGLIGVGFLIYAVAWLWTENRGLRLENETLRDRLGEPRWRE